MVENLLNYQNHPLNKEKCRVHLLRSDQMSYMTVQNSMDFYGNAMMGCVIP